RSGSSAGYLNQMEHNQRPLSVPVLLRITEVFGVDPTFFAASDTSRLIAELRAALTDVPNGEQVSTDELDELASAMPSVARVLVDLHRRYREVSGQAAALAEGRGHNAGAGGTMGYGQGRGLFDEPENTT